MRKEIRDVCVCVHTHTYTDTHRKRLRPSRKLFPANIFILSEFKVLKSGNCHFCFSQVVEWDTGTLDSPLPPHWVKQGGRKEKEINQTLGKTLPGGCPQKKPKSHGSLSCCPRQLKISTRCLKHARVFIEPLGHVPGTKFMPTWCKGDWRTSRDLRWFPIPDSILSLASEFLLSSSK